VPRCRLERVAIDLTQRAERRRLLESLTADARDVLVLTEGVVPYLAEEEVASLASDLRACPAVSQWITDYFAPQLMKHLKRRPQFQNAPFRFDPPDWTRFFADNGFELDEMRYLMEYGEKVGRKWPLPLVLKLMIFFKPSMLSSVRRVIGYARLRPRRSSGPSP
jgi:O-methyltransferase involved in polyketide biosynthesis